MSCLLDSSSSSSVIPSEFLVMVIVIRISKFQIWVAFVYSLMCVSIAFNLEDNYLIDCGSTKNTSVNNRVFLAESAVNSNNPSTPENILINTSLNSVPTNYSDLYNSARIFTSVSNYSFSIKKQGRHWIRLHFFDFNHPKFNLSNAKFSVSTHKFTLIREFKPRSGDGSGSFVREYCLEIDSDRLVVTFSPFVNSFAFVNALEVVSIPDELIPQRAETSPQEGFQSLQKQALETVARVNMGNQSVSSQRDVLSRFWDSDDAYLRHNVLPKFVSNVSAVNFNGTNVTDVFAPADVYGTGSVLNSEHDPNAKFNITWIFEVDPGFQHLVRFHFCDLLSAPYYMDFIVRKSDSNQLNVSIGPAELTEVYPNAILNGLEIMKINNSRGSLDVLDSFSSKSSKMKVGFIVGIAVASFIIVVSVLVLILICRRRRRLAHIAHLKAEDNEVAMFSSSKIGYRFPFVAIQEATGNFNESFVIGVGGFGKVYKGVLRDETKVAVKRGGSQSHQGLAEFRTEIEMLSQFRHRHLVSLIGPVIDPTLPREKVNLIEWVMRYQTRGQLEDIVDPNIINQIKTESLKKFREIAEKCLAECGLDRPSMGDVLWNLECALQLQGKEEKSSSSNGDMFSQVTLSDHSHSQTSVSTTQFSIGDLAGASMSKVFAQMVREETREM
ncbi:hypothetical protein QYF36_004755 [Acer negundo]|nr:hypothetical protein QYF36_004755 [Acer negundo]